MVAVPYVSFDKTDPVTEQCKALAAVGRCRVDMTAQRSAEDEQQFRAIVDKNRQQALVGFEDDENKNEDEVKKLKKKYMKQGNALAAAWLQTELQLDVSVVDVEIVVTGQDLIDTNGCLAACLLDAGCALVVVKKDDVLLDALEAAQVPKERLMVHYATTDDLNMAAMTQKIEPLCSHLSVDLTEADHITAEKVQVMLESQIPPNLQVVVQFRPQLLMDTDDDTTQLTQAVSSICRLSKETKRITVALQDPSSAAQLGLSYAACLQTDRPDGLYTTVVCSRDGTALGLVYSLPESVVAALESGRGVYYSRSRGGLWRKGDTSGHYQTLHRLDVDCDGDALRFTVTQRGDPTGAFCHLNTLTCWGPPRGLRHLEETLQERLASAPEGSYTKRLFDDMELLKNKLVEEAQELAEADTPQHVAEELADVMYFAMTRAVKAGVSIDDAVAELDKRTRKVTRRKGDSKAFRIAAGQAILDKTKEEQQRKSG